MYALPNARRGHAIMTNQTISRHSLADAIASKMLVCSHYNGEHTECTIDPSARDDCSVTEILCNHIDECIDLIVDECVDLIGVGMSDSVRDSMVNLLSYDLEDFINKSAWHANAARRQAANEQSNLVVDDRRSEVV